MEDQVTGNDINNEIDEITREVEKAVNIEEEIFGGSVKPAVKAQGLSPKVVNDALNSNEDGDAGLFIALQEGEFRFDHSLGKWFKWAGHYWEEDGIGNATAALDSVIDEYSKEAMRQSQLKLIAVKNQKKDDEEKAKEQEQKVIKRIHDLQTVYRKKNVLYLATQGDGSLGITGDEWDRDPWLLGCRNGIIDLRTGELRPGKPEDYIKTVVPTEWKGLDEQAPLWEKFLLEIFENNEKMPPYLQRLFGYGITGLTIDHVIPIFWGHHGRNGKSTIFDTLFHVLGSIIGPIPSEMLLSDGRVRSSAGPSPDIMALRGRRIAWASETEEERRLAVEKVKLLTGADTLTGRPPHGKKMIEFRPTHKLFLLTNHKPSIPPTEYAMWERIHPIPFTLSYVDEPKEKFERKRDAHLPEKLKAESSGIMAWLVKGCLEWQRVGLNPPDLVKQTLAQYKEDEDILGFFLSECTKPDPHERIKAKAFYGAYRKWCEMFGHKPLGGKKFGERMGERLHRTADDKGRYYEGLVLTDFADEPENTY